MSSLEPFFMCSKCNELAENCRCSDEICSECGYEPVACLCAGKKYDGGKPRLDLIPPLAEWAVGEVLGYGAAKYGEENWREVEPKRYLAAVRRHLNAIAQGEVFDAESGLQHAAHAIASLMMYYDIVNDEG